MSGFYIILAAQATTMHLSAVSYMLLVRDMDSSIDRLQMMPARITHSALIQLSSDRVFISTRKMEKQL